MRYKKEKEKTSLEILKDSLVKEGQKEKGIIDSKTGIVISGRKRFNILGDKFIADTIECNNLVEEYVKHTSPCMTQADRRTYAENLAKDFLKVGYGDAPIAEAIMYTCGYSRRQSFEIVNLVRNRTNVANPKFEENYFEEKVRKAREHRAKLLQRQEAREFLIARFYYATERLPSKEEIKNLDTLDEIDGRPYKEIFKEHWRWIAEYVRTHPEEYGD
jgi:hypothetical protein